MQVTRVSSLSGFERTRDLPVQPEQLEMQRQGCLPSTAFPHLSIADRIWLQSGITQEEWDGIFKGADENDNEGCSD